MDVWTSGGNTSSRKEVFKGEMGVEKLNRNRRLRVGDEEQPRSKVLVINEEILGDKTLSLTEKFVYARICYFEEFFESAEATAEYLGIGVSAVKRAKRTLEDKGNIVCVKDSGRGKVYVADVNYGIWKKNNGDVTNLSHQTYQNCNSRYTKNVTSDVKNCNGRCVNLSHIDKELNKNIGKKENKEKLNKKKVFEKPSVDEVRAYCEERKNNVNPEAFVDFYESKGWVVGKSAMKNWKAAVRTWERNGYGKQAQTSVSSELYKPNGNEDVSYQRLFEFWKQFVRVSVPQTKEQVEACKALLEDLGEEGVQRLIVALAMRSKHSYLPSELTKIKDFVGLRQNAVVVQNFYDQHWRYWQQMQKASQEGKEVWEV